VKDACKVQRPWAQQLPHNRRAEPFPRRELFHVAATEDGRTPGAAAQLVTDRFRRSHTSAFDIRAKCLNLKYESTPGRSSLCWFISVNRAQVSELIAKACPARDYRNKRVLLIVPDGTRTAPVGLLFQLSMIKLEVSPKLWTCSLPWALTTYERERHLRPARDHGNTAPRIYRTVRFFNHAWDNPASLKQIGTLAAAEISQLTDGLFSMDVPVEINRMIFDYESSHHHWPGFFHMRWSVFPAATSTSFPAWRPANPEFFFIGWAQSSPIR